MNPGCTTEHKVIAYKCQFNNKAKVKRNSSKTWGGQNKGDSGNENKEGA